ncbi:putative tetratricopeptide repeat protein [Paratrimastix pyriformis]|uniref:Tetratricopeptide repeat protein n=1 Tax=Paratrimastix pyriformis TaxID=342808 RepID=A0ABQ8UWD2_9EUKA|nr:putative tetratricopeptide repeat protein [Paratrimastix pyriformis]|eukprot:GAFH01004017.1.p1 GENE.GAFH01004017.1~~GAFH01004017.1.p1  ORF type:complete len:246 (-),score=38.08 GAFH01004017.1:92-829(-)
MQAVDGVVLGYPSLIRDILLPPQAPTDEIARLLESAHCYHNQSHYERAVEIFELTLQKWSALCDQKEPPLEVSLYFHLAVGEVFESAGLDDEALATYLAAVKLSDWLPDGHPDIATPFARVGGVHFHALQMEEAVQNFLVAKVIREETLGPNHPDTAAIYHNLACCMLLLPPKYDECMQLFKKALAVFEFELGPEHPRTETTRRNLTTAQRTLTPKRILKPLPPPPEIKKPEAPAKKKKGKKKKK